MVAAVRREIRNMEPFTAALQQDLQHLPAFNPCCDSGRDARSMLIKQQSAEMPLCRLYNGSMIADAMLTMLHGSEV